jgi:hypothetical protein
MKRVMTISFMKLTRVAKEIKSGLGVKSLIATTQANSDYDQWAGLETASALTVSRRQETLTAKSQG